MEDSLYRYLRVFNKLPLPVRRFIGLIYSILPRYVKYGRFYNVYGKRIAYFNQLGHTEIIKEQEKLLFRQVNYAISNIPYYSQFGPCDSMQDFKKLPVINKNVISCAFHEFLNPKQKNLRIKTNTGGSSGTPLEFYLEKDVSRTKEKAHFDWYWGQFGYKPNDRILMIRGLPLCDNRLFEYRAFNNALNVSCYNVNRTNISQIVTAINRFKPLFIHAYPSSLKEFTVLVDNSDIKTGLNIKSIFLGSENLPDVQRQYFEHFYGSPAINWYGHTERLAHGGNCPYSNEYHFYPFYGYMELLDENNEQVCHPDDEGRIVATGFDNHIMPFIRYDTGDLGVLSGNHECKCGFKGISLQKIVGRGQDIIVLKDGTRVSLTAFIFGQHLEAFNRIRGMQVIQHKIGEIEMRIVKNENFTVKDEEATLKTLLKSVNNNLDIYFTYVDSISRTSSGKCIFFISLLK